MVLIASFIFDSALFLLCFYLYRTLKVLSISLFFCQIFFVWRLFYIYSAIKTSCQYLNSIFLGLFGFFGCSCFSFVFLCLPSSTALVGMFDTLINRSLERSQPIAVKHYFSSHLVATYKQNGKCCMESTF